MYPQPTLYLGFMNGHHKLTISGVVFYVEDCCREVLTNHIEAFEHESQKQDYSERIAELLLDALKDQGTQVVSPELVQYIIKRTRNLRQPD